MCYLEARTFTFVPDVPLRQNPAETQFQNPLNYYSLTSTKQVTLSRLSEISCLSDLLSVTTDHEGREDYSYICHYMMTECSGQSW